MGALRASTIALSFAASFAAVLVLGAGTAVAQLDSLAAGVYERGAAVVQNEQDRAKRERAAAEEQKRLEADVRRQQEEMMQHPGSFPRQRLSYEARSANNPWEKTNDAPAGVKVDLFVADQCPACERMEKFLDEMGVPYARYYLAPGSEAEQQYLAQIGRGIIPVVRINRRIVRGYQPDDVRHAILAEKNN